MGDTTTTKTKLTEWSRFRESLLKHATKLRQLRHHSLLAMSEDEYSRLILELRSCYESLDLSESKSTVVVNSKALHHLFPELIPPIDRQYTIRFFKKAPDEWRDSKGKFRAIQLPAGPDAQFDLFHEICGKIKGLSNKINPALLEDQRLRYGVTAPKAVDNAIVSFVRIVSARPAD